METERGAYPRPSDKVGSADPSTTGQAGAVGKAIETGLEQAGVFVKDAVDKTRDRVAEYRDKGMEQLSQRGGRVRAKPAGHGPPDRHRCRDGSRHAVGPGPTVAEAERQPC